MKPMDGEAPSLNAQTLDSPAYMDDARRKLRIDLRISRCDTAWNDVLED